MIDLHTHTTASDGTFEPSVLVKYAESLGLTAIAITDHDTLDGIKPALRVESSVEVVPGTEISIEFVGPRIKGIEGHLHLLVYYPPLEGPFFDKIRELQEWRQNRNLLMVSKLNNLGFPITMKEIRDASGGGQIGSPHFASVLVKKGLVKNKQDAFDTLLGKGKPAHVGKKKMTMEEALPLVRAGGGIPVLAHPCTLHLSNWRLKRKLKGWAAMGLLGVETIYPDHSPKYREYLTKIASRLGLAATGGSDFHGSVKPDIELGSGRDGNVSVPLDFLTYLKFVHEVFGEA